MKKIPHDLASYQEKVFEVDDHCGIVISGMTADARFLTKFMRNECMNYDYAYGSKHPAERLVVKVAQKAQVKTTASNKRPFGVGLLVAGIDAAGTHLFENCIDGNFFEYHAMAIGDRCQSAKTYMEKHFESFANISVNELIKHGIEAMRASAQETDLTENNISVGVVGKDEPFRLLSKDELKQYIHNPAADVEMN